MNDTSSDRNASKQTPPPRRYQASLDASWKEGIFGSIMIAVTDYYLIPLGLLLGASPFQIGLLVAVPHLLGSIVQLVAVRIVRMFGSQLTFIVRGALTQATFLLPVAFLPFLRVSGRVGILVVLVTIFRILAHVIGTAWGNLVSSYLPSEERGRYFGWRSQIVGMAGVGGVVLGALLLFLVKKVSPDLAFFLLFLLTALTRFQSARLLAKMEDVPIETKPEADFTFYQFLIRFRESNFVKFVFYVSSITFATNLAAPYFSVFMLRDLHMTYLEYMAVHLAAVAAGLVAFPIWGRHADVVGNARVLKLTGLFIPVIPVLWIFSHHTIYLVMVEIIAGFVWGGFNLCTTNFIYDAVAPEKRMRCLSYFNLINGIGIFAGASVGGYWADHLPAIGGFSLHTLFILSGLGRFVSFFLLSRKFREVRESAEKISSFDLFFSVVGLRPLAGGESEWNVFPFVRKPPRE